MPHTLQSIGEGVITTNTKGQVEQMNSVAEQLMGLPLEQVRGRPASKIFQLMGSSPEGAFELNPNGDFDPTASGTLLTSGGNSWPIVLTAAPISLPAEKSSGTVIVFRDMTRENELQREVEQVRRLDALGQLAGGVAHDFNNVLGGIVGAAEFLNDEIHDEKLREVPQQILESANGAAKLTAQLLSFARKQPVTRQVVHTHETIDDTVAVLRRTIDPRIKMDVHAEAENDVVEGDRTLLKNCLLNLGINASHAMKSGGTLTFTTREVSLESNECEDSSFGIVPGRYVEVQIEDNGTGIHPEIIARIFEPFFTTKEQGKGTGLGLAAVFGTIQQHDGSVTVETELGRGTNFVVRLPLAEQPERHPLKLDTAVQGSGVVLVVDDQDLVRQMAARTLEGLGYEVLVACDGLEAVEVYEREREQIDVVLLDMIMPRMSGPDCFVELKRLDPNVRVIATSGFSSPEDLHEMQILGLAAQLPKPYGRAELSNVVSRAIATVQCEGH